MKVSIIGLGFVGNSIYQSLTLKGLIENDNLFGYDKFKNGGIGNFEDCLKGEIMFLALPTLFDSNIKKYDKTSIYETCEKLENVEYQGTIVIKSTVEPETTLELSKKFPKLSFIHNPEFLTARTAFEDFHNQTHVVLGCSPNLHSFHIKRVEKFYKTYYPNAEISICSSTESESMKIFCNSFYSVKVQFFTELYLLCQKNGCDYTKIRDLMIKNTWINPMHTTIPGPDGNVSYGGACFPKDTNALNQYLISYNSPNKVLEATITERNQLRDD